MRIAQVTFSGYFNYGNILQKFALHHTLKKFTDSTEVLWLDPTKFFPETGQKPLAQCASNKARRNGDKLFFLREAIRQSKFKSFENLHIKTRFDFPYIEDIAEDYDFFIVGSDQVWNPRWHPSYIFLEFIPRERKAAYAASIGFSSIPDNKKELFRRGTSGFKSVSVRDENSAKIVSELTGQTPEILPDPVLLLNKEEWLAVSQKPTWFKEKYRNGFVLTYYLRMPQPPEAKIVAEKLGLPVINLLDPENYNHFTCGPAEVVWLFAHASFVVTNSFHGLAFSILFKRPFVNIEYANDALGVAMLNRMTTMLKRFEMEDRTRLHENSLEMDFTRATKILTLERARAFKFLSEALL